MPVEGTSSGRGGAPSPLRCPVPAEEQEKVVDVKVLAKHIVMQLSKGEHKEVHAAFDTAMKAALSPVRLAQLWPTVLAGEFTAIERVRVEREEKQYEAAIVTCRFERALLDMHVVFDIQRQVTGLSLKPANQSDAYRLPSYVDVTSIQEVEVSVGQGKWALPGTISQPAGAANGMCPGVVLVHGSGPHDRDETVGANKPFKDIALGLASRGVCVLRYEKRTHHHADLAAAEIGDALTVEQETVVDAVAAAEAMRAHAAVNPERVFILGHSLGGYAIPRIAPKAPYVRGFIVMAGPTRPLEDLVLEQIRYISNLNDSLSPQEEVTIAALKKRVMAVKSLTAQSKLSPEELPMGIAAPYWLDLRAHNAAELAKNIKRPILVLHGERDFQVTLEDLAGWERALTGNDKALIKRYPALNHMFFAGEGKSDLTEYQTPGNVEVDVVDDIAAFVASK